MGSVRSRIWKGQRVWFIDYVAATGQRIRQTIGPGEQGKRLAKRVLAQREAEAQLGIHRLPASRTPTFAEVAADWLQRLRGRNLSPKTLESYEGLVRLHLLPTFGHRRLGSITRRDVELFLAEKSAVRAAKTVGEMLTLLKAILADAVAHGHLAQNPAAGVRVVRPDREETMHILTPHEVGRLLDVAEEPWRTLYLVAVHTGLRRGELLALRWSDFDLAERRLYVRRSLARIRTTGGYAVREVPLKTRHSRRMVDFSPTVADALLRLPAGDDPERDFVFRSRAGGAIDPDNVDRAFKRHLAMAGLPVIRFHDLRHTHASLLIAAGVHPKAIQARLGHSSITVTMDRYGHLMPSAFQGVGERLDALLQGKFWAHSEAERVNVSGTEG
jgi:integrase